MNEKEKIIQKLKELKSEIKERYKVNEIGVFGSYVRNEQTANSDIDILIDYERGMTIFKFCELENWLSSILGKKVDLVMKKSLKPNIGKRILNEVIYI